jgi:hypothetical protein
VEEETLISKGSVWVRGAKAKSVKEKRFSPKSVIQILVLLLLKRLNSPPPPP